VFGTSKKRIIQQAMELITSINNGEMRQAITEDSELSICLAVLRDQLTDTFSDSLNNAQCLIDQAEEIDELAGGMYSIARDTVATATGIVTKSQTMGQQLNEASTATAEINITMNNVACYSDESQKSITDIAAASTQMTSTIEEIASNAENARSTINSVAEKVDTTTETLNKLESAAKDIKAKLMKAASHGAAIKALSKGVADVAIIKNRVYDSMKADAANKDLFDQVEMVGKHNAENPNGTLMVANGVSDEMAEAVKAALLAIESETSAEAQAVKKSLKVSKYLVTTEADFKDTLPMLKAAGVTKDFNFKF